MRRSAELLAALVLTIGGGTAVAQVPSRPLPSEAPTRFRVGINHVEIDATVVDRRGRFVGDLGASDFDVIEDGQPQTLSTVALVDIPLVGSASPATPAASVGRSVILTNDGAGIARLYVLVLDDLNTDAARSARVRSLARRFITTYLQPGDIAAVLTTGSIPGGDQDFTSQTNLLVKAVDAFVGSRAPSAAVTLVQLGCFRL